MPKTNKNKPPSKNVFSKALRSPRMHNKMNKPSNFGRGRSHTFTGSNREGKLSDLPPAGNNAQSKPRSSPLSVSITTNSDSDSIGSPHSFPIQNSTSIGDISSRSSDLDLYREYSNKESQYASHSNVNCPFRFMGVSTPLFNEGMDIMNTKPIDRNNYHVWRTDSINEINKRKDVAIQERAYEKGIKSVEPFPFCVPGVPNHDTS